jgi:hypothetical protein
MPSEFRIAVSLRGSFQRGAREIRRAFSSTTEFYHTEACEISEAAIQSVPRFVLAGTQFS